MQTSTTIGSNDFITPFRISFLISIYIIAITSLILNSASPRVFAEQGYYSCYGVSNQDLLSNQNICDLPLTNSLAPICIPEGDPINLRNYFYRFATVSAPPQDYPLNTKYIQDTNPGDPIILPTQIQNYNYPLSVTFTQPSYTGTVQRLYGLEFTGNGNIGVDQFTYTITNSDGDTDSAAVIYRVINGPVPSIDSLAIPKAINSKINSSGSVSTNFGTSTVNIITPPTHGTAVHNGAGFVYTPNPNYSGGDIFTYQLSDSTPSQSSIQQVIVKVYDPNTSKVLAFNLDSFFSVGSNATFNLVGSSTQNGGEVYYLRNNVNGQKKEVHDYNAVAPAVSATEVVKVLNLNFQADVSNDHEQIATPPFPVNDVTLSQPIRVEHKNTAPVIASQSSDFNNNSATITASINDPENNNFDVIFELSKDNFSTISNTFTLSNQSSGTFNHIFTSLDNSPYSYRVRSQEVGTIPNLCNSFSNARPQSTLNNQSTIYPLRSSGGTLYGVTNTIPAVLTSATSPILIRTGGCDK